VRTSSHRFAGRGRPGRLEPEGLGPELLGVLVVPIDAGKQQAMALVGDFTG